jgi:cholest-4-en-3-one 26-monooxygenase
MTVEHEQPPQTVRTPRTPMSPVDIFDPEQYRAGVPHEKYTQLRAVAPVAFQSEVGGRGFWAVTKHADIVYMSKNPGIFSSQKGGINIPDIAEADLQIARTIMINMDPPQHARYRKLVSTSFTPRMTARLESSIRAAVDTILDRISGKSEVDFVATIASQLPLFLIADLIGWPEEDRGLMFDWSDRVARIDYDPEDARDAAFEFYGYCATFISTTALKDKESGEKPEDLLHTLLDAEIGGEKLDPMEIVNFLLLLAIGGNETTRNCISGGFLALHNNPEQLALFKTEPKGLSAGAAEEMLRWVSPITAFRRTATEDTELRGVKIPEGDKIVMYYASANRDEDVFTDSQRFDITRDPNPHLAFGTGQHFCMGATLARLEIQTLFEALLERYPDMKPVDGCVVERLNSNYVNAYFKYMVNPGDDATVATPPAPRLDASPA